MWRIFVGRGIFSSAGPRKYDSYFRRPLDRRKCGVFSWAGALPTKITSLPTTIFVGLSPADENKGPKSSPSRAPAPSRSFESPSRRRSPHAPRRAPRTPRCSPSRAACTPHAARLPSRPARPCRAATRTPAEAPRLPLVVPPPARSSSEAPRTPLTAPPRPRRPTRRRDSLPAPCRRPQAPRRGAPRRRRPPHPPASSRRPPCAVARLASPRPHFRHQASIIAEALRSLFYISHLVMLSLV
jgi:hypothetical protein